MSSEQVYVVAVSGGVDSVALLHMLVNQFLKNYQLPTSNYKLIIAHFDHGIREESGMMPSLWRIWLQSTGFLLS